MRVSPINSLYTLRILHGMKDISKRYTPSEQEPKIQEFWDENDVYAFKPQEDQAVFSVDTPPPTLSGEMHLGHAFSYAQGDFIARYRRMRGDAVLYPFGTDDNGLPTERLIEKQEKVRLQDMGREEFIKLVNKSVTQQQPSFMQDWKSIGIAADFKNAYSTITDHSVKTSQKSFIDLYKKGLVRREESPVSWCPKCRTAIAQAEFESQDTPGQMNTITFESMEGDEYEVMTTRPELIPACVAVAAHPEDARYEHLAERKLLIPLSDRFDGPHEVPVIFDESVDPEKGTGLMMVCTFGDKEDVEKWRRHELDSKFVMQEDGRLTKSGLYSGMRVKEAREAILADLESEGLLVSQELVTRAVNTHERCGTPLEFVHTTQWFVDVLSYKQELLEKGREVNWYPDHMRKRFEHWVENLGWDWCISRQRPYGVPFPVWYDVDGEVVLASEDELPVDPSSDSPKKGSGSLTPELDVMDTWATSSLTPQIVLNWAGGNDSFTKRFPMSLRLQAHDIIRTWAFYTIVKGLHHHGSVPWRDIVISGHALDPKGRKMSKSKGNAIRPQEMTTKYGADAIRFWAAGTKLGEDLPFQEKDLVTAKKMITKLWNAARFASMHLEDYDGNVPEFELELADSWLLTKFYRMVEEATEAFDEYEYSRTKMLVEQFFWGDFCDDYLELVKNRLYNPDERGEEARLSAQFTLYTVLLGQLKLLAPIMPHVSEKVYQLYFRDSEGVVSLHNTRWPAVHEQFVDDEAFRAGELLNDFLAQARKYKSDRQLSMRAEITHAKLTVPEELLVLIKENLLDFLSTSGVVDVELSTGEPSISFE